MFVNDFYFSKYNTKKFGPEIPNPNFVKVNLLLPLFLNPA